MCTKWIYTILVLALGFFTSCNNEADETAGNKKTRTVVFRLAVDDAVGSRATWGENYTQGNANVPFDTRINLDGLQVVVYDANNRYIGKAENVLYWSVSGNENENSEVDANGNVTNANEEYQFVGDLSNLLLTEGTSYKFMVFANCPIVENGSLGNLIYDVDDIAYDSGFIPMWGVTNKTLTSDELQDLKTIDLLRAVAKVEVIVDDKINASISDVNLTRYNKMGYCLPKDYANVLSTRELTLDGCMNEYRLMQSVGKAFIQVANEPKYFIYVPEYDNMLPADEYTQISLKVNDIVYDIQFTEYENGVSTGERFDLVRNHIYRYTITDVKTSGQLVVRYEVADWKKGDIWELDFSYPTYVNPVMPYENIDTDNTNDIVVPWNPIMEYDSTYPESKAFSCWFQITGPTGQTWIPVLKQGNNLAEIKVYKDSELKYESSNPSESQLIADAGWYNIKIIPNGPYSAENPQIVEFGITYTPSFDPNGGARYLLINGEANNYYWMCGNYEENYDPRLIRIHQVQSSSSD